MIGLLLGVALAADPAPPQAPEGPPAAPIAAPTDDPYEIIVWGEGLIRDSRARVIRDLEELGWTPYTRGDRIVLRPPQPWMGKAHLTREGLLYFGRPVIKAGVTRAEQVEYDAQVTFERNDAGGTLASPVYVLPSNRLLQASRAEVLAAIGPSLDAYRDAIGSARFDDAVQALPALLDRLWSEGIALDGARTYETPAQRREIVLALWASRAETPEGDAVRATIELWLRETVQPSAWPITAEERARAEARARRPLPVR